LLNVYKIWFAKEVVFLGFFSEKKMKYYEVNHLQILYLIYLVVSRKFVYLLLIISML